MQTYKFVFLFIGLMFLSALTASAQNRGVEAELGRDTDPIFCTMDAFQCPDGSWVGRTGPNCEFVCPVSDSPRGAGKPEPVVSPDTPVSSPVNPTRATTTRSSVGGSAPDAGSQRDGGYLEIEGIKGELRGVYIKFDDIKGEVSESEEENRRLRVEGGSVREWDEATREAVKERLAALSEINTANDFGLFVAQKALENERVSDITVNEEGIDGEESLSVEVSYLARVRFLGIFGREVEASTYTVGDNDRVITTLRAPWYIRWLSVNTNAQEMAELAKEVKKTGHVTLLK